MTVSIREASAEDIGTLRTLAASIWRAYYPAIVSPGQIEYMLETMYSPGVIRHEMANGVIWRLVFADSDRGGSTTVPPVGFLSFDHDRATRSVKLHKLYLLPRLHGRGVGQQMLAHVAESAARAGAQRVCLQVNKRNTRAIRSYERAGFRIADSIVDDIGGGFVMDDYVMTLTLGEEDAEKGKSEK